MKFSTVALVFAAAIAAQEPDPDAPQFLNSDYTIVEGEPFTLTFSGCEEGCTIILMNGDRDDLQPVEDLTSSATGGEFTFTLDNVPSDEYAFRIVDNPTGLYNHSPQFDFEGTGEAPATTTTEAEVTSTTEAPETTTEAETTTTEEETSTTTEEEETTTETTVVETTTFTTTASDVSSTTEASSTETDEATTTGDDETEETEPPNGGAGSLARPMALVVGAVGAMLLLN